MAEDDEEQVIEQQFDPQQALAAEVVRRRTELNMTQADLAAAAGISLATIQAIEAARAGSPRPRTAAGLERGLKWITGSVVDLMAGIRAPLPASSRADVNMQLKEALVALRYQPQPLWDALRRERLRDPSAPERALNRLVKDQPRTLEEAYRLVDDELGWQPGTTEDLCTIPRNTLPRDEAAINPVVTRLSALHPEGIEMDAPQYPRPSGFLNRLLPRDPRPAPSRDDKILYAISASRLPTEVQQDLAEHLAARRQRMEEQLSEEIHTLIEALQKATRK